MDKKILFLASTRGHVLHFHAPYLAALKAEGNIIHTGWAGGSEPAENIDRIFSLPFAKSIFAPENFKAAAMLRKIILTENYDAVLVHTSLAAFFTRLALLGMKKRPKCVNMVHGYLFDDQSSGVKKAMLLAAEKLTAPVTDLVLTMNRWDFDCACRHHLGKRVEFIPGVGVNFARLGSGKNASELRKTLGIDPEAFVMVYPAEFSERKSQRVLLQAMTMLPENAVLVLPGTGTALEECKSLSLSLDLGKRVIFPGYAKNIGDFYDMSDAAVSASRSEGLPFNIMEAMHFGLPLVASRVKGHTDLVRDGENGFLYPYGNAEAFAAAVLRLIQDKRLCRTLGETGRARVQQYSLENVLPIVIEKYQSLLQ